MVKSPVIEVPVFPVANYLQLHKFHSKQSVRIISSFKTFDLFVLFPIIEFERNGKLVITNNEGTEENRQETEIVVFSCHACLLEAMIHTYSEATFRFVFSVFLSNTKSKSLLTANLWSRELLVRMDLLKVAEGFDGERRFQLIWTVQVSVVFLMTTLWSPFLSLRSFLDRSKMTADDWVIYIDVNEPRLVGLNQSLGLSSLQATFTLSHLQCLQLLWLFSNLVPTPGDMKKSEPGNKALGFTKRFESFACLFLYI